MSTYIEAPAQTPTQNPDSFFEKHRPKLLAYLDGKLPASSGDPGPLDYIDSTLDEWRDDFLHQPLQEPADAERTFWFALYHLDLLVEFPPGRKVDPHEKILLQTLAVARELLRNGEPLPDGYFASRPGET